MSFIPYGFIFCRLYINENLQFRRINFGIHSCSILWEGCIQLHVSIFPKRMGSELFQIICIDEFWLLCDFRFGILPYRKPIHVVVGAPIEVEWIEYPSKEDIEELHTRYVEELTKLYDRYNPIYGDVNIKLVID